MSLRARVEIASLVAEHWTNAIMESRIADVEIPWRAAAHPLGCVRAALDGEQDPKMLGIEDPSATADQIRKVAEKL